MSYASPIHIPNGLALDFTVDAANTSVDNILGYNSSGELTSFTSIPRTRVSGGGNVTEVTSAVLTITGGTGAVLTSGLTIQVKLAGAVQSGYLSSTDWNTFNNKLGTSLTSGNILVGNGSNVATSVSVTGDITISNAGVVAIASGVIVDADVNNSAAIAVTKLAPLTASRALVSNGSGFVTWATTTATEIGYVNGVTSPLQTQLNTKLTVTLTSPTSGDYITYNGSAWVNTAAPAGSLPTGGTANQILRKIDGTNYNTDWHTLVAADITDVTSSAAELNALTGVTTTATQFNYLNTVSSNVQTQINSKLTASLTLNSIWVGNASNFPTALATGTNGYVLTSSSGVPTWAPSASVALTDGNGTTANGSAVDLGGTLTSDISLVGGYTITSDGLIKYNSDLSGSYDARSHIDKGYADISYWKTVGTTALTGTTQINSATNSLILNATSSALSNTAYFRASTSTNLHTVELRSFSNGSNIGQFTTGTDSGTNATTLQVLMKSGGVNKVLDMSSTVTGISFTDAVNTTGLFYAADYSTNGISNAGNRWIPDAGYVLGAKTFAAKQTFFTSTSGSSAFNIPQGAAVSSPNNGDFWTTSSGFFGRINGVTYNFTTTGSGITNSAANTELMMSDGTNAVSSGIFISTLGDLDLGTGLSGSTRTIKSFGSATDIDLELFSKGDGDLHLHSNFLQYSSDVGVEGNAFFGPGSGNDGISIIAPTNTYNYILGGSGTTGNRGSFAIKGRDGTGTDYDGVNIHIMPGAKNGTGKNGSIALFTAPSGSFPETIFGGGGNIAMVGNRSTSPSSGPTDGFFIYSKDSSAGSSNATLALYTEQAVEAIGTFTPANKLRIWINEVEYWIQLDPV